MRKNFKYFALRLSRVTDRGGTHERIYGSILTAQMSDPSSAVKVKGIINYFADTLLFADAILTLASATPRTNQISAGQLLGN